MRTQLRIQDYCVELWSSNETPTPTWSTVVAYQQVFGYYREVVQRPIARADVRFGIDSPGPASREDIIGNGTPDVVVASLRSASCCDEIVILDLGDEVGVVFDVYVVDGINDLGGAPDPTVPAGRSIVDLDGDGSYEVVALDQWSWQLGCEEALGISWSFRTVLRYDAWLRRNVPDSQYFPLAFAADLGWSEQFAGSSPLQPWTAIRSALSLFAACRPSDAWRVFDDLYSGPDKDNWLSWLQAELMAGAPWHEPSLEFQVGRWGGEIVDFAQFEQGGSFEMLGGGDMIEVEIYGDAPLGRPVGRLSYVYLDDMFEPGSRPRKVHCQLVRGPELRYGLALERHCERSGRYSLRLGSDGQPGLKGVSAGGSVRSTAHLWQILMPAGRQLSHQ